jgi:hypothetical protein
LKLSQLFIFAPYEEEPNKITSKYVFESYSDEISDNDVEVSDTDDSATSMGDEEDDDGDILKQFLSNQSRDKFLPQKGQERYELKIPS